MQGVQFVIERKKKKKDFKIRLAFSSKSKSLELRTNKLPTIAARQNCFRKFFLIKNKVLFSIVKRERVHKMDLISLHFHNRRGMTRGCKKKIDFFPSPSPPPFSHGHVFLWCIARGERRKSTILFRKF